MHKQVAQPFELASVSDSGVPGQRTSSAVDAAILIAALYFGRELFIPLVLAALLAFAFQPAVRGLRRTGVPHLPAVLSVVLFSGAVLSALALYSGTQVKTLAESLPQYQTNLTGKIAALRERMSEPGVLSDLNRLFGLLGRELQDSERAADRHANSGSKPTAAPGARPTQVEVISAPTGIWERALAWTDSVAAPLLTAGLVAMYVVLFLLSLGDLRDRAIRLLGLDLHISLNALDDAGTRIGRYLLMQLAVNTLYGLPLMIGLAWLGIPGAVLWGMLAIILRFVPYLGPLLSAVGPLALAVAVDPGWSIALWVLGLYVSIELLSNNLIEPWLYGASTGLSAISLIAAASFWTLIWGPVGLVVATPLTVCLLVLGRYVPALGFLDVLLGSDPAMDRPSQLYQRLVAGRYDEASDLIAVCVESQGVESTFETVVIPAMCTASQSYAGSATPEHRHRILSGLATIIAELEADAPVAIPSVTPILCVGGRWELDMLSAKVLAHSLSRAGIDAQAMDRETLAHADLGQLEMSEARRLVIAYFSPEPAAHLRQQLRRLRRRWPDLQVHVVLWTVADDLLSEFGPQTAPDITCHNKLAPLLRTFQHDSKRISPSPARGVPAGDVDREDSDPTANPVDTVEAGQLNELLHVEVRPQLERLCRRVADVFDVNAVQVNLLDDRWLSTYVESTSAAAETGTGAESSVAREETLCHTVAESRGPLVVEDVLADSRFSGYTRLREQNVRFYAGCPIFGRDNQVLGVLCLLDDAPRSMSPKDVALLQRFCSDLMGEVNAVRNRLAEMAKATGPRLDERKQPLGDTLS